MKRSSGLNLGPLIIAALIGGCGLIGSLTSDNSSSSSSNVHSSVQNSSWDGSVSKVEEYVKRTLRDPDSYQSIEWGTVQRTNDGGFSVRHKFRAKNGFGGYEESERVFYLDSDGNVRE